MLSHFIVISLITGCFCQPPIVTSPSFCLSNTDCPSNRFCDEFRCVNRFFAPTKCSQVHGRECADGRYCTFVGQSDSRPGCRDQLPLNAGCDITAVNPCLPPNICSRQTGTCRPFDTGFEGDSCVFDRNCQQTKGFYCDSDRGVCRAKLPDGAVCGVRANNHECQGICIDRDSLNEGLRGVCAPSQRLGGLCSRDRHCFGSRFNTQRFGRSIFDTVRCNIPTGSLGRCVKVTKLIKKLGARCNPKVDMCDAERGLSCRNSGSSNGFVCQQKRESVDREARPFCTPNNGLSTCLPVEGIPQVCRRGPLEFIPNNFAFPFFFSCQARRFRVAEGGICERLTASCAPGTTCGVVPGVLPATRYCRRILNQGASCENKFGTGCRQGLSCINGKCVNGTAGMQSRTHVGLRGSCSESIPCAPGTVCRIERGIRSCRLPVQIVRRGAPCFPTATADRQCADGLICRQSEKGLGPRRCRDPFSNGGICGSDADCKGNLKCSTFQRDATSIRRCFDPTLTLGIGEKCNQGGGLNQKRCVQTTKGGRIVELRCMPKGSGSVCQIPRLLYERCAGQNERCVQGTSCAAGSKVCLPSQ